MGREERRVFGDSSLNCFNCNLGLVLGLREDSWLWPAFGLCVAHFSSFLGIDEVLLYAPAGGGSLQLCGTLPQRKAGGHMLIGSTFPHIYQAPARLT